MSPARMKKASHTPAPWVDVGCYSTIRGKRRNVVIEGGGKKIAEVVDADDAVLIIAAPDMFEALEHARHRNHPYSDACAGCALADAALAKARGAR